MLIVIVFTVNRYMPNLTAIEVAKAHLAAKEKEKEDGGKSKGKEHQTGKKKGAPAKGIHQEPTENAEPETEVPVIANPKEGNAQLDTELQV
jgi:hypothetical protein